MKNSLEGFNSRFQQKEKSELEDKTIESEQSEQKEKE
jgi:hypothetical protein